MSTNKFLSHITLLSNEIFSMNDQITLLKLKLILLTLIQSYMYINI